MAKFHSYRNFNLKSHGSSPFVPLTKWFNCSCFGFFISTKLLKSRHQVLVQTLFCLHKAIIAHKAHQTFQTHCLFAILVIIDGCSERDHI